MRITAVNAGVGLLALGLVVLVLVCAYLVGYWSVFGEHWYTLITLERLLSLPTKVGAGFAVMAMAFVFIAYRLKGYACGRKLNVFG